MYGVFLLYVFARLLDWLSTIFFLGEANNVDREHGELNIFAPFFIRKLGVSGVLVNEIFVFLMFFLLPAILISLWSSPDRLLPMLNNFLYVGCGASLSAVTTNVIQPLIMGRRTQERVRPVDKLDQLFYILSTCVVGAVFALHMLLHRFLGSISPFAFGYFAPLFSFVPLFVFAKIRDHKYSKKQEGKEWVC